MPFRSIRSFLQAVLRLLRAVIEQIVFTHVVLALGIERVLLSIIESTLKSGIIDYSDCTTTDFWTAMVIEFDSIKCQVLIRM